MGVEDIELDVGGVKFKGVYIAILMSFATTIGGGIWAASEFVSRIDNLEASVASLSSSIPDIRPYARANHCDRNKDYRQRSGSLAG